MHRTTDAQGYYQRGDGSWGRDGPAGVQALPKCKDCPGRASLMCCENKPPDGLSAPTHQTPSATGGVKATGEQG